MGLTLFAELGFAAVQVMLGIDAPVSVLIVRDMLLKSVYAFFLGWPIYLGVRRACARRWSRSRRCAPPPADACWGPRSDVPPLRRARPRR